MLRFWNLGTGYDKYCSRSDINSFPKKARWVRQQFNLADKRKNLMDREEKGMHIGEKQKWIS